MQGTSVQPTYGHCDVGLAFHIEEGEFNGVSLGGLNFLAANYTPGPMGNGNWTSGFYVDELATPEQREAMEQILSGQMGGPAERWRALTTDRNLARLSPANGNPLEILTSEPLPSTPAYGKFMPSQNNVCCPSVRNGTGTVPDLYCGSGKRYCPITQAFPICQ